MPTVKSALVCILAFVMGICVGAVCAFVCMKYTTYTASKLVLECNEYSADPIK